MKREIFSVHLASVIFTVISLMLGCSDPTGGHPVGYITGTVKDSRGQPVPNAYLNMFYFSVLDPFRKTGKTTPTTSIEIAVEHPGFLRVHIENYVHVFIRELFAGSVAPGTHVVNWDGKDAQGRSAYTDCYWIVVSLDGVPMPTRKMLNIVFQYDDPNPAPFAMTDRFGRFSIPFSRLPLTEIFTGIDYSDFSPYETTIGPTDLIYAFTPTSYGSAIVTYSNPRELTIVLSEQQQ